jgi:hypothetical protein
VIKTEQIKALALNENPDFYAAVGRFTIVWARLDMLLDVFGMVIHEHLGGKERSKRPPKPMEDKLNYLAETFGSRPEFSKTQKEAINLIEAIRRLAGIRNDLIHGFIVGWVDENSPAVRFVRWPSSRSDPATKVRDVKVEEINAFAEECQSLSSRLNDLTPHLLSGIVPELAGQTDAVQSEANKQVF